MVRPVSAVGTDPVESLYIWRAIQEAMVEMSRNARVTVSAGAEEMNADVRVTLSDAARSAEEFAENAQESAEDAVERAEDAREAINNPPATVESGLLGMNVASYGVAASAGAVAAEETTFRSLMDTVARG